MRTASCCILLALGLLAACATHPPGSSFALAHRDALLAPLGPVPRLRVQWLGVTTLLFSDGDDAILIDAFLSRPSLLRLLFGAIGPAPVEANAVLEQARSGPLAGLFVAHAHHDHVLDAGATAQAKGARLFGSASVLNVARGAGLREGMTELTDGQHYPLAGFTVRAFATPHSDSLFPAKEIAAPLAQPAHALRYGAGQNFSFLVEREGRRILVVPSAASRPGMFGDARAELVFLGIGGLGKRPDAEVHAYWDEAVRRRGAKQVILIHWDNFLYPPDGPLRTFGWPLDDVDKTVDVLSRLARRDHIGLHFVRPGQAIAWPAPPHSP